MSNIVYFLFQRDEQEHIIDGICKIGSTSRIIDYRIKELQTGNPDRLMCYTKLETQNHTKLESWLHKIHKVQRKLGEWYCLTTEEVDNLCDIFGKTRVNFVSDESPIYQKVLKHDYNCRSSKHVLPKITKSKFVCDKCDKIFSSKKRYDTHITNVLNPCDFICMGCGFKANSSGSFYRHKHKCTKLSNLLAIFDK